MIMACYAVALCNDQTLLKKRILSSTIDMYLAAAARLSAPFEKLDPCKNAFGQKSNFIKAVLKEHKRWESMPNRRDPLTPKMIKLQQDRYSNDHCDSLNLSLLDWFILGIYVGPRKSEWCQDKFDLARSKTYARNIDDYFSCRFYLIFILTTCTTRDQGDTLESQRILAGSRFGPFWAHSLVVPTSLVSHGPFR